VKKIYLFASLFIGIYTATAQSTYLPSGTPEYHLLDRLETSSGELTDEFSSMLKPISRKDAVEFLIRYRQDVRYPRGRIKKLTYVDEMNLERALSISGEWSANAEGDNGAIPSKKPILKYFYQKQPDLIHVDTDDFFMVINPVIYAQYFAEGNKTGSSGYINTRGVELRARIFNKVGFYTLLGDNQEKSISYIRALEATRQSYPGFDYYAHGSATSPYDAFLARGYIDFSLLQEHVQVTFGYDKNFIGDGLRSLFLSDLGAAATFLRLRSKLGKINYENLFMELMPDYARGRDRILPKKYAAMHQINMNVTRWLNLGIFESTIFGKPNHISAGYFVPIIMAQTAARALGANQKTSLGVNFKMIPLTSLQLYGQGYFDQLSIGDLSKGWWGNQFGIQLGAKYFDAFTIDNLDLQAEVNIVRPFTYTASDSIKNYTHYNQPLAHPYGSGFAELITQIKFQPTPKLYLSLKGIFANRGYDLSNGYTLGYDIFTPNYLREKGDYNYSLIDGNKVSSIYANINAAFELRPNIFIEVGGSLLQRKQNNQALPAVNIGYAGLRWNIAQRSYDYF
jgi:hypothetical protein